MRRWLNRLLKVSTLACGVGSVLCLTQNPFAQPLVERSVARVHQAVNLEMHREVTPEWLSEKLDTALQLHDLDTVEIVVDLAAAYHQPLPVELLEIAQQQVEEAGQLWTRVSGCGSCAVDIASCERISQIASCAMPFEMSPLGDANALRRAAVAVGRGQEVDRIDTGLALVGLTATGAALLTGGTSLSVKAGSALIRSARKIGALTPSFSAELARMTSLPVNWARIPDLILGRATLDQVTDTARLDEIRTVVNNLGVVRDETSMADTLVLLKAVDSPADAASLAVLARAEGPATRATLFTLGKVRALRLTSHLAGIVWATLGLMAAFALQALALVLGGVRRIALGGTR